MKFKKRLKKLSKREPFLVFLSSEADLFSEQGEIWLVAGQTQHDLRQRRKPHGGFEPTTHTPSSEGTQSPTYQVGIQAVEAVPGVGVVSRLCVL